MPRRAQAGSARSRPPARCRSPRAPAPGPMITAFLPAISLPGGSELFGRGERLQLEALAGVRGPGAPGAGVQARTCRSHDGGRLATSRRGRRRRRDPRARRPRSSSSGCGRSSSDPSGEAVERGARRSPASSSGEPVEQSARGVVGVHGLVISPYVGSGVELLDDLERRAPVTRRRPGSRAARVPHPAMRAGASGAGRPSRAGGMSRANCGSRAP